MHIADVEHGALGANAIVAAGVPHAVGAALSAKMQGLDRIAVTFFGEGATNQGVWHEALNLAAIWQVPVLLILENNMYAEMTPIRSTVRINQLADRAAAYGIRAEVVDGMDVEAVYSATVSAAVRARQGGGPTLIEAHTYRFKGHMIGDLEVYRTREEVEEWITQDPIRRLEQRLRELGVGSAALADIDVEVTRRIEEAAAWAISDPESTLESAYEDVWA
jgi:TPP-dependent pyruvate/acetoin dehydrogenase alpha subunit